MGLADKHKAAHVRSAKKWLEKAEQSFDNQSTVKGELNLMLAEAEMKNLRKQCGNHSRLRYFVDTTTYGSESTGADRETSRCGNTGRSRIRAYPCWIAAGNYRVRYAQ